MPTSNGDPRRASDDDLNPHRADDSRHASELVAAALRQRGVHVEFGEDGDQLATVLEAVERFERAVAWRGGDSMLDSLQSDQPEDPAFVIPQRRADEGLGAYARRVRDAAERIGPDPTGLAPDPTRMEPDELA